MLLFYKCCYMRRLGYIILIMASVLLSSCSDGMGDRLPRSVGGTSEVLFITQNKEQWEGAMGQAVRDFFEKEQYGLPQPEKNFDVVNLEVSAFSEMFQKHRNLIVGAINKDLDKVLVETQDDWKSAPQFVMRITAPDVDSWVKVFNMQAETLKEKFDENERERFMTFFRPNVSPAIAKAVNNAFGISMLVPDGFFVAVNKDKFMWLRRETDDMSMGLLIYETPYRDTTDLSPQHLVAVRDSVVKKYVPGPLDGTYMTTDKKYVYPVFEVLPDFPAGYAVEMRGLWNVVGDFMGGPFVSYTIVNPEQDRLLTIEGFVYYPNKEKRDELRKLESVIYSARYPDSEVLDDSDKTVDADDSNPDVKDDDLQ